MQAGNLRKQAPAPLWQRVEVLHTIRQIVMDLLSVLEQHLQSNYLIN
ncbi:hypothetical protein P608_23415 [Comamonas thiooxydans]|uniref:Uncharacterized protein n=1 Tax=Comamonas thiooxydans TaxID=363952 RepID=A0A0E3BND7_9BURK|nr:hypothetical protein P608_23415 [Comamonas thiooxydans]KGH10316.1 hypothetical protein P607_26520 [Comamonas thiooxydans]KGH18559.1 hypothetical protein P606_24845 [Comamonas thiooxydans]